MLYIILFLYQTTTRVAPPRFGLLLYIILFLYQTTTEIRSHYSSVRCISSYSYIKPQLSGANIQTLSGCISSYSYIKPQLLCAYLVDGLVVYHPIPISNHNWFGAALFSTMLYIILFLYQTTTYVDKDLINYSCISSYSYIKPQPLSQSPDPPPGCISSYSYIKPQPWVWSRPIARVVYHPIPISNHNFFNNTTHTNWVVYHPIPISNHNPGLIQSR